MIERAGLKASLERLGEQINQYSTTPAHLDPDRARVVALAYIAGVALNALPEPAAIALTDLSSVEFAMRTSKAA